MVPGKRITTMAGVGRPRAPHGAPHSDQNSATSAAGPLLALWARRIGRAAYFAQGSMPRGHRGAREGDVPMLHGLPRAPPHAHTATIPAGIASPRAPTHSPCVWGACTGPRAGAHQRLGPIARLALVAPGRARHEASPASPSAPPPPPPTPSSARPSRMFASMTLASSPIAVAVRALMPAQPHACAQKMPHSDYPRRPRVR